MVTNLRKHNFYLLWGFCYIFSGIAFNDWWWQKKKKKIKISIINTIKRKLVKFLTENMVVVVINLQCNYQPTWYLFYALEIILFKGLVELIVLDSQMEQQTGWGHHEKVISINQQLSWPFEKKSTIILKSVESNQMHLQISLIRTVKETKKEKRAISQCWFHNNGVLAQP